jgi:transposase
MTDHKLVSIDLAKTVFQVCRFADGNKVLSNKKISRKKLSQEIAQLSPTTVVMEACYSAHYWGRVFESYGHTVQLVPAQHVKPFVRGNKNDANDAVAIAEASLRPNMRFVRVKTIEQQDIQSLHKIRERFVSHRTRINNQTRGLLSEYGLVAGEGFKALKALIHEALESDSLTELFKEEVSSIYEELLDLEERLKRVNNKLKAIAEQSEFCRLLMTIPGIGVINATAIYAAIGDGKQFATARDFAVWMGLTPQHYASGTKSYTGKITKRGNRYLRKQLVHGARSLMNRSKGKTDKLNVWINDLKARRGQPKACVALAHKLARICWAVLTKGEEFKPTMMAV